MVLLVLTARCAPCSGFLPVENSAPCALTAAQIAHYNERGYTPPLRIYDEITTRQNREYFDEMMATLEVEGRSSYSINGFHLKCRRQWDMATHPMILDMVEDLLGPNFVMWGSHFFCKQPHDNKPVPLHQDATYWPFQTSRTCTVWLAIDDADEENAAMSFLSGSHTQALPWVKAQQKDSVLGNELLESTLLETGLLAPASLREAGLSGWDYADAGRRLPPHRLVPCGGACLQGGVVACGNSGHGCSGARGRGPVHQRDGSRLPLTPRRPARARLPPEPKQPPPLRLHAALLRGGLRAGRLEFWRPGVRGAGDSVPRRARDLGAGRDACGRASAGGGLEPAHEGAAGGGTCGHALMVDRAIDRSVWLICVNGTCMFIH
jgi:hypothetical protein